MADGSERIRRIVKMEERILACGRCGQLKACSLKPSLGKGDLNPHILIVFASENNFTRDRSNLAQFKDKLRERFGDDIKVYYTYLVRCQPKLCRLKKEREYLVNGKYIMASEVCILSGNECEGSYVEPNMDEMLACVHYLLEEIDILEPKVIVTIGEKTCNVVFKTFGIFAPLEKKWNDTVDRLYEAKGFRFLPTDDDEKDGYSHVLEVISRYELERFFKEEI